MSVMSGRGLGIYGNSIVHREQNEFDKKAHRALNGEPISAEDAAWDEASPEQIRAQFERLSKSDQEKATAKASQEQLDVWVKTRPEYRDTPSNAKQLLNQCKAMFGTVTPTAEQADLAFLAIADTGLLDIDQKELAKQKDKRDTAQAKAIVAAGGVHRYGRPTEQELYDMPLDELRRLGNTPINTDQPWQTEK